MRTNIIVPDSDWKTFRIKVIEQDKKMNQVVVKLIQGFNKGDIKV